jgi:DNA oxidative demethylase
MRPEGLTYVPEFVGAGEERDLVAWAATLDTEPVRMRGGVGKRETIHFGYRYDYDGWTIRRAGSAPLEVESLLLRCAAAAGVDREKLEQVMVARYPPGASIGWHRDAPMFGSPVIGVSLLASCEMRFRRAKGPKGDARRRSFDTYSLLLEPRSLYLLDGDARSKWQHSIPATTALRYSITMRTIRNRPSDER